MLHTLARKHRSTVSKMAARHKVKVQTPHGLRTRFEASAGHTDRKPLVAWFGGIPLKRQKNAVLTDRRAHRARLPEQAADYRAAQGQMRVLRANRGTFRFTTSGRSPTSASPGSHSPRWAQVMATIRRKTLVVCGDCHDLIHGHPAITAHAVITGKPDTRKRVPSGLEGG